MTIRAAALLGAVALTLGACAPGWALWVENHTDRTVLVRVFLGGPPDYYRVGPGARGIADVSNAPAATVVDIYAEDCEVLGTTGISPTGGNVVTISSVAAPGEIVVTSAPTEIPKEITDPRLTQVETCE